MDTNDIITAIKLYDGMESLQQGNFTSDNAVFLTTIHNQTVGKPFSREPRDAVIEDGMESILGTLKEWGASISKTVTDWFNDYDRQEMVRIEKEFKGGASAYAAATVKDAILTAQNLRKKLDTNFDKYYDNDKFGEKSFFKGLPKKDAKAKLLKEIDHCIEGMKNPKMQEFYLNQIKKNTEKHMLKIVAKISYLKSTHVKYKNILEKKKCYEFLLASGFYPNKLEEIKKGGDTIIRKLEMIKNNGTVLLDIQKTQIFKDLENYINAVFVFTDTLYNKLEQFHKAIADADNDHTVSVGNYSWKVKELQSIIYDCLIYMMSVNDAVIDLNDEVSKSINATVISIAGIPEYISDAISKE